MTGEGSVKFGRQFLLPIAAALLLAGVLGAGMTYDGSYYLYNTVEWQQPFIPNNRIVHGLIGYIPLTVSHITDNVGVLQATFGILYALVPIAALVCAWWITRKRARGLFVWAACGICIVTLPGQIAYISEGAMASQLAWTLYFGAMLGIRWRDVPLMVVLAAFIALAHPSAFLIFGITALLSLFSLIVKRYREKKLDLARLLWTAIWGAAAIAVFVRFNAIATQYEREQLSLGLLLTRLTSSAIGPHTVMLIAVGIAGLLVVLPGPLRAKLPVLQRLKQPLLLKIALVSIILWAVIPIFWIDALSYRFFVLPFGLPFILFAAIDYFQQGESALGPERWIFIQRLGLIMTCVLGIQAVYLFGFAQLTRATLAASPTACLSLHDPAVQWMNYTLLNHWSIPLYTMVVQGRQPDKIVLFDTPCANTDFTAGVPLASWDQRGWTKGWFDMTVMRAGFARMGLVP